MYVYIYIYICMYVCMYACMYVCMDVYVYVYIYIYIYTYQASFKHLWGQEGRSMILAATSFLWVFIWGFEYMGYTKTPTSHSKNSLSKIFSKGWVAQKAFC